jgi:protein-disulfide isomerase
VSNLTARSVHARSLTLLLSRMRPLFAALAGSLLASCAQGAADDEPTAEVSSPTDAIQLFAGIQQQGNVLGDPAAPVTLTEFSDLRCSHCRDFAKITLPVIVDHYVRTGRVRVVFGNLPILGPASVQVARMAAAVGLQGHLFEFTEVFFRDASGPVTDDLLRRIASEVPGVDVTRALADKDSQAVTDALAEVRGMAQQFSIVGTPSVLLGKTGAEPHIVSGARATLPQTVTAPIDETLAQP